VNFKILGQTSTMYSETQIYQTPTRARNFLTKNPIKSYPLHFSVSRSPANPDWKLISKK